MNLKVDFRETKNIKIRSTNSTTPKNMKLLVGYRYNYRIEVILKKPVNKVH